VLAGDSERSCRSISSREVGVYTCIYPGLHHSADGMTECAPRQVSVRGHGVGSWLLSSWASVDFP